MRKLALVLALVIAPLSSADVIVLKDGSRVEGDVKRVPEGWMIRTPDGKSRTVAPNAVRSIELGSAASRGSAQAAEGLASLRRSVEALNDIDQIIERYQRFIENAKDGQVAADAKSDLADWRRKRELGYVKHGAQWVRPEEVAAMSARATALAVEAQDLLRQNRTRDADKLLQQALDADPLNAAALYLRGVLLYRTDKLPDARKAFEAANEALEDHAPTLNNLAVIHWRQNQQPVALNYFDQAMMVQPVNKFILNNVAEALGTLPEDQRKGNAAAKVYRRFTEQDLLLQQQMAQQGLYRWGSNWVDQKRLDELKAAERQVREKLESMQAEFEQTKSRIAQIDGQVRSNETQMNDIRARSLYQGRDKDGNPIYIAVPLPQSYYDLQRENQRLAVEQNSLRTKLGTMQDQAKRAQQQVPVPQFTGVQQLIGVEGMPGPAPAEGPSPTTAGSYASEVNEPVMPELNPTTQSTDDPSAAPAATSPAGE